MLRRSLLVASFAVLALSAGCSSKDSSSPAPVAGGPALNLSFPGAGNTTVVGTQHIVTFTEAGSWGYYCVPHQSVMTGTVVVSASSTNDSAYVQVGAGSGTSFFPTSVTIKVGGTVRFANVSAMTIHTVTRP